MKTKTTIVCWPTSQLLMDQDGFRENSALCNSDRMYNQYGDSSYAVNENWLKSLPARILSCITGQDTFRGPRVDFEELSRDGMLMMI